MKDILAKLAALEGTAQPAGKKSLTESTKQINEMWGASDHAPDKMNKSAEAKYVDKLKARNSKPKQSQPAPAKKVDEVSAAAMGHVADREYANQDYSRPPMQAPAAAQRKCYIVQKGTNKKVGQAFTNFGDAQRARSKMPNPDQYSLIKEDGTVISEKQLTELSKGTLGDYVKGASHHAAHLSSNVSHFKSKAMGHISHQGGGMKKPNDISDADWAKYNADDEEGDRQQKIKMRRLNGIGKAVGKLTTESRRRRFKVMVEGVEFNVGDSGLAKVLKRFPHEVNAFKNGEDLSDHLYDAVYDHYCNNGEMPYGTMKARDGDPYEWVTQKLDQELSYDSGLTEDGDNVNSDLKAILSKYPYEAKQFTEFGELDDGPMYEEFFDHYLNAGEMPYGVAKARTGDPVQWVAERLEQDLGLDDGYLDSAHELSSHEDFSVEGAAGDIMPMGEEVLNETDPAAVTHKLTSLGYDEGLDFFFDGADLVVIGRSTARVVLNALRQDGGIGQPAIGSIDGEEVRISFSNSEVDESLADDFMAMAKGMKNKDGTDRFPGVRQGPALQKPAMPPQAPAAGPAQTIQGKDGWNDQERGYGHGRYMGDSVENDQSPVSENVNMNITASGEDDVLGIIRKLSGLGDESEGADLDPMSAGGVEAEVIAEPQQQMSLRDMISMLQQDGQEVHDPECDDADMTQEIGAGPDSAEVEVEEDQFANTPEPSVHTSTAQMMNQGNDLNRPKQQYARSQPGDNPMAVRRGQMQETAALYKQYSALLAGVKSK